jgi:hypothetical protein
MKLLGLIRKLTFFISTLDILLMLYFVSVRSKLEYAPVTVFDSSKLYHMKRKFAALCQDTISQDMEYRHDSM